MPLWLSSPSQPVPKPSSRASQVSPPRKPTTRNTTATYNAARTAKTARSSACAGTSAMAGRAVCAAARVRSLAWVWPLSTKRPAVGSVESGIIVLLDAAGFESAMPDNYPSPAVRATAFLYAPRKFLYRSLAAWTLISVSCWWPYTAFLWPSDRLRWVSPGYAERSSPRANGARFCLRAAQRVDLIFFRSHTAWQWFPKGSWTREPRGSRAGLGHRVGPRASRQRLRARCAATSPPPGSAPKTCAGSRVRRV